MGESLTWASCSREEKACVRWIERYFKDCVCNVSGEISFGLGIVSLFFWGVAEIPQIVTNFRAKSGHGISLAFLLTWVIGDIFNLVGCLLEPATLPTQFYTAVLYTATTALLVLQILYYDYWVRWWKTRGLDGRSEDDSEDDQRKNLITRLEIHSQSVPTPISSEEASPNLDVYYTSARSLASSMSPPSYYSSSYLRPVRSGPSCSTLIQESSSDEDDDRDHDKASPTQRTRQRPNPQRSTLSRSVGYGTFIATSINLPSQTNALREILHKGLSGRRLLQETGVKALESNTFGLLLGWTMAAIYMGGRLPQIYLNIKRGSVEGLNPLMFMFALVANATYVGSILVRSVEWERIKPNAPWLLDAIVCVLLDLFIIIQYAYYKFLHRRNAANEDRDDGYEDAQKPFI